MNCQLIPAKQMYVFYKESDRNNIPLKLPNLKFNNILKRVTKLKFLGVTKEVLYLRWKECHLRACLETLMTLLTNLTISFTSVASL